MRYDKGNKNIIIIYKKKIKYGNLAQLLYKILYQLLLSYK